MSIIFGPVNSRRFGLSLGVDLSPKIKQCNFDCVYCELKAAKPIFAAQNVPSVEEVVNGVKEALSQKGQFSFITITANGEPSLYPHLDELVKALNLVKQDKKLLILSNGTGVLDELKFKAILGFDMVKFSLDSAVKSTFFKIDRAVKSINLEQMIDKMSEFKALFKGELVMEVLVVQGFNDSELEFKALNEAFARIKPDRVDISSIDRPSAYPVKAVREEKLQSLAKLITAVPVLVPKRHFTRQNLDFSEKELLKMLTLRPQSEFDIENFSPSSKTNLQNLLKNSLIFTQELAGVKFYRAK